MAARVEGPRDQTRPREGQGRRGRRAGGPRAAGVFGAGLAPRERELDSEGSWVPGWRLTSTGGLRTCPGGSGELWSTSRRGPARPPVRRSLRTVWPHRARWRVLLGSNFHSSHSLRPVPPTRPRPLSPDGNLRRRVCCGCRGGGAGRDRRKEPCRQGPPPPPPPLRRSQTARGGGRGGGRRRRACGARAPGGESGGPPLRLGERLQTGPGWGKMGAAGAQQEQTVAGLRHLPTPPTTCCTSSLSRVPWPLRSPPPSLHTFPGTEEKETWESPQEALIRVTTQTNFPGIWGVGEHLPTEDQAKTFAGGLFAEPKGKADTVWLPDGFRDHLAKRDLGNPSPTPAAHALETWLLVMPEEVRRWCQWVAVSGSIQGGHLKSQAPLGFILLA